MFRFLFISTVITLVSICSLAQQFNDKIVFQSKDGTHLHANLFTDTSTQSLRPCIIMVNSWSLEEHEYIVKARQFAKSGYNVFSYSARGWGKSEGEVKVASPEDLEDLSAAIDWLIANTNTNPKKIGMTGISYGAGISLLATAFEPRIRAISSMSGWVDLEESLYPGQTPNELWAKILLGVGQPTGRISNEVFDQLKNVGMKKRGIQDFIDWAKLRSANQFVEMTNKNNPAILIFNNWSDGLFHPNSILRYFSKLKTPKKLILQEGIHASNEAGGLVGAKVSYDWDLTLQWFDYWLKDKKSKTFESPEVSMQIRRTDKFDHFQSWPTRTVSNEKFYLTPRLLNFSGDIKKDQNADSVTNYLISGPDSGASTGFPVLGAFIDAHLFYPVSLFWSEIKDSNSFSFVTESLESPLKIRGIPEFTVNLQSNEKQQTVVAYLYDINELSYAKLITHGVKTFSPKKEDTDMVKLELFATAYDIPKGHKLGIVLDTKDEIYKEGNSAFGQLELKFQSQKQNSLSLPLAK